MFEDKENTDINGKSCAYCGYPSPRWKDSDCNHDKWVKAAKEKEDKKPVNVKETAADFFRKYSNMIAEAEEDDSKKCPDCGEVIGGKKHVCKDNNKEDKNK